jgi:hypothetical protein
MSVFIDTGIFIAYVNRKDEHHDRASALLEDIMKNKYGPVFTSDFVFNEAVTFVLYKTGDIEKAKDVRNLILGNSERGIPRFINLLYVDGDVLQGAWKSFLKYADKRMSFTDCSSIELMGNKGIEHIASFDGGFDGIVSRLR